jgi:putative addiction module killer protein
MCIIMHTYLMTFHLSKTTEFDDWFEDQNAKIQGLVRSRFSRIELNGYFGETNHLGDGLFELKWKSGLRVYYAFLAKEKIIVILGGTKNGQDKDIKKAKKFIR